MEAPYSPVRRVVTGHDESNVAKVIIDAPATNAKHPQPGLVSTMMSNRAGVAFVLVDAEPLGIKKSVIGAASAR